MTDTGYLRLQTGTPTSRAAASGFVDRILDGLAVLITAQTADG